MAGTRPAATGAATPDDEARKKAAEKRTEEDKYQARLNRANAFYALRGAKVWMHKKWTREDADEAERQKIKAENDQAQISQGVVTIDKPLGEGVYFLEGEENIIRIRLSKEGDNWRLQEIPPGHPLGYERKFKLCADAGLIPTLDYPNLKDQHGNLHPPNNYTLADLKKALDAAEKLGMPLIPGNTLLASLDLMTDLRERDRWIARIDALKKNEERLKAIETATDRTSVKADANALDKEPKLGATQGQVDEAKKKVDEAEKAAKSAKTEYDEAEKKAKATPGDADLRKAADALKIKDAQARADVANSKAAHADAEHKQALGAYADAKGKADAAIAAKPPGDPALNAARDAAKVKLDDREKNLLDMKVKAAEGKEEVAGLKHAEADAKAKAGQDAAEAAAAKAGKPDPKLEGEAKQLKRAARQDKKDLDAATENVALRKAEQALNQAYDAYAKAEKAGKVTPKEQGDLDKANKALVDLRVQEADGKHAEAVKKRDDAVKKHAEADKKASDAAARVAKAAAASPPDPKLQDKQDKAGKLKETADRLKEAADKQKEVVDQRKADLDKRIAEQGELSKAGYKYSPPDAMKQMEDAAKKDVYGDKTPTPAEQVDKVKGALDDLKRRADGFKAKQDKLNKRLDEQEKLASDLKDDPAKLDPARIPSSKHKYVQAMKKAAKSGEEMFGKFEAAFQGGQKDRQGAVQAIGDEAADLRVRVQVWKQELDKVEAHVAAEKARVAAMPEGSRADIKAKEEAEKKYEDLNKKFEEMKKQFDDVKKMADDKANNPDAMKKQLADREKAIQAKLDAAKLEVRAHARPAKP